MSDYDIKKEGIEVHGMKVESFCKSLIELKEMITFCEQAHKTGLTHHITNLFYDEFGLCRFETAGSVQAGDLNHRMIESIARSTLEQFELFGVIHCSAEATEFYDNEPLPVPGFCVLTTPKTIQ